MTIRLKTLWQLGFVAGLLVAASAHAQKVQIVIDTGAFGLNGTNWDLAFDLNDGNPQPSSVAISDLLITGGSLTNATTFYPISGNVSGDLSVPPGIVTMNDSIPAASLFNEYTHNANLGTSLAFVFDITGSQDPGFDPDTFSFFFIDPSTGQARMTADPTGAVFVYSIGNDNQPSLFQPEDCPQDVSCVTARQLPQSVPEPGTLALAVAGLIASGLGRSIGSRSSRQPAA